MPSALYFFKPAIDDFVLTKEQILTVLGYNMDDVPDSVIKAIEDGLKLAYRISDIKCGFKIFSQSEIKISRTKLVVGKLDFDIKNIISLHLRKAESVALFAATIGPDFDNYIKSSEENDILDSFIVNTIGSELVEMLGDWIERRLKEVVGNKNISNRLSPGYCGWNVSEQKKLFGLLGEKCCGIQLNESSLMTPIKSISGIIGFGEKLIRQDYQCKICELDHCYKRKRVETNHG